MPRDRKDVRHIRPLCAGLYSSPFSCEDSLGDCYRPAGVYVPASCHWLASNLVSWRSTCLSTRNALEVLVYCEPIVGNIHDHRRHLHLPPSTAFP